jgi:hypothetical protein
MIGFPPSTNNSYRGSPLAAWFLMLVASLEFVAGCIHYFLPDGGAGVIAGIDLSQRGGAITAVFAWFGAVQIPMAILLFIIGLRYRTLVPLALLVVILSRGLMAIDGWFLKGAAGGHHPPEHFASPVTVVLGVIFFTLAVRDRPAGQG